ncbi:NAD(P)-binding protein [Panus rudis PR-1116 ss-1]|nr:NAD(P)-binding protein [Panus rudis PR-1116 ss-1]
MAQRQVWLVTGASSGFGRLVTEIALSKGEIVVATARKPETLDDLKSQYDGDHFLPLKLDVTNADEVTTAFTRVAEVYGRLDVVFNNAGQSLRGEIEAIPEENARALLETNFWGAVEPGEGGRLLNMSSVLGIKVWPLTRYYSAAKHALEAVTKAFVTELDPEWSIKYIYIDPPPAYSKPSLKGMQLRKSLEGEGGPAYWADPRPAALMVYRLAHLPNPPLRLPLGRDALEGIKEEIQQIQADVDAYASWTDEMV